jgi:hypothetical protein
MNKYRITLGDQDKSYEVEAETVDEAIDTLKAQLGIEEVYGDIEEIV